MLENIKGYLRIDGDYDDQLLETLIYSAENYLLGAGVKKRDDHLYKIAITMLVTHWYENREQVTGSTPKNMPMGLKAIILQMGLGEVNESN